MFLQLPQVMLFGILKQALLEIIDVPVKTPDLMGILEYLELTDMPSIPAMLAKL